MIKARKEGKLVFKGLRIPETIMNRVIKLHRAYLLKTSQSMDDLREADVLRSIIETGLTTLEKELKQ